MAYGTIKVDNITFTNGGVDQTITVSGVVQSISGDITATGTIQAATIIGTSTVSGATVTGDSGQYGNLNSISGVFTTQVSGATVTGDAGSFTTVTGGVATITSGVFALGTDALPSISFSSDPNTGIYSPGADQVAISTNGTQRINIEADGDINIDSGGVFYDATNNRLAVGTASPDALLTAKASSGKIARFRTADTNFFGVDIGTNGSDYTFIESTKGGTGSYQPLSFWAGGNRAMDIDTSGRLLVGTTTAISVLEGSIDKVGTGVSTSQAAINIGQFCNSASATARPILNFYRTRGTQATPTANSSGDLLAQINFNAYDGNSTDSYGAASIGCFADAAHGVTDTPGRLVFSTNPGSPATAPVERMKLDNRGQLSLQSTTSTFDVATTQAAGTVYSTILSRHSATSGSPGTGTLSFRVYSNGDANNTNGIYTTITSDERFKQDIVELGSQWNDIKGISLKKFRYKNDPTGELQLGVIAQELQQVCPGLVTTRTATEEDVDASGGLVAEGDKVFGWKMSILPLKAVKALQEAMERIETLEAKVAALEAN